MARHHYIHTYSALKYFLSRIFLRWLFTRGMWGFGPETIHWSWAPGQTQSHSSFLITSFYEEFSTGIFWSESMTKWPIPLEKWPPIVNLTWTGSFCIDPWAKKQPMVIWSLYRPTFSFWKIRLNTLIITFKISARQSDPIKFCHKNNSSSIKKLE